VGLMAQSWAALAYIVIANAIIVAYRTSVEEKALISELGDQYISYTRRVKRLIPFIL
jgi:protein-S-isoprenylcysteine O-methyltransferase Ste14